MSDLSFLAESGELGSMFPFIGNVPIATEIRPADSVNRVLTSFDDDHMMYGSPMSSARTPHSPTSVSVDVQTRRDAGDIEETCHSGIDHKVYLKPSTCSSPPSMPASSLLASRRFDNRYCTCWNMDTARAKATRQTQTLNPRLYNGASSPRNS